jgi:hypothetical protein
LAGWIAGEQIGKASPLSIGKKNLPVPEARGGKVYRYWIVLDFHTTRRYMKLVEISH